MLQRTRARADGIVNGERHLRSVLLELAQSRSQIVRIALARYTYLLELPQPIKSAICESILNNQSCDPSPLSEVCTRCRSISLCLSLDLMVLLEIT